MFSVVVFKDFVVVASVYIRAAEWLTGAGEQAGELAEGAGRDQSGQIQSELARDRADHVARIYGTEGQQPVTARSYLGSKYAEDSGQIYDVPQSVIDGDTELSEIATDIRSRGLVPHLFTGEARLVNGSTADAMIRGNDVYIRVDSPTWTATQNWEHEKFHGILGKSREMISDLWQQMRKKMPKEKLWAICERYREAYHGILDVDADGNPITGEELTFRVAEEILADAYAGKDPFAQDVEQFSDIAHDAANQIEESSGEIRGPPNEEYTVDANMTESERYQELKDKVVVVHPDSGYGEYGSDISSLEALEARAKSKAEKVIIPLAKKLGILNRKMKTPDLEIEFTFSKNNGLSESTSKQLRYGGSYADFAKALLNLDGILENSVLIERHTDKYKGTIRENPNLLDTSVLLGVFADGSSIIPVQFEIKNTVDTGGHLYMTVTMTKIEAGVLGSTNDNNRTRSLLPASNYKIADVFANVNPRDKHFLKYVPDNFLSEEQLKAKQEALDEDAYKLRQLPLKQNESFSVNGTPVGNVIEQDLVNALPKKAQRILETEERKLTNLLANALRIPYKSRGEQLDGIARAITTEFLQTGSVSEKTVEDLFEKAYRPQEQKLAEEHGIFIEEYRDQMEQEHRIQAKLHLPKDCSKNINIHTCQ